MEIGYLKKVPTVLKRVFSRVNLISLELLFPSSRYVNFVIGGAQKGGTSALDWYLRQHSEICMASCKEVHFFDNEFLQRIPSRFRIAYYHSFFSHCKKSNILGEATPIYVWWPGCLKRIREYNHSIKIIFILRDPVARAYSHWNMERQRGFEKEPFSVCVRRSQRRVNKSRIYSYISRGFYSEQIQKLKASFPEKQLLFIKHEDLLEKPSSTLKEIANFLSISEFSEIEKKTIHARDYDSPISSDDENFLRKVFVTDIEQVEHELGWDLSDWKGWPNL